MSQHLVIVFEQLGQSQRDGQQSGRLRRQIRARSAGPGVSNGTSALAMRALPSGEEAITKCHGWEFTDDGLLRNTTRS